MDVEDEESNDFELVALLSLTLLLSNAANNFLSSSSSRVKVLVCAALGAGVAAGDGNSSFWGEDDHHQPIVQLI